MGSSLLMTLFCCHLAVLSMLGIILAVWINKSLLRQFSRQGERVLEVLCFVFIILNVCQSPGREASWEAVSYQRPAVQ